MALIVIGGVKAVKADRPLSTEPTMEKSPTDPVPVSLSKRLGGYLALVGAMPALLRCMRDYRDKR